MLLSPPNSFYSMWLLEFKIPPSRLPYIKAYTKNNNTKNFPWNPSNFITYAHHNILYSINHNEIHKHTSHQRQNTLKQSNKINGQNKANNIKYIQTVKIISLTTDFKTKIPPMKVKIHMSRSNCQNFSSIWRLTKWESSFYQKNTSNKNMVAPNA